MHQKGVSAILASVLIVLVSVSLAGAFLIYSQRSATQLTEAGTTQQQTLIAQTDVRFAIKGVANNKVFLKNLGENNITYGALSIFLDETLINYTLPSSISPGTTGTLVLNQTWKTGLGEKTLRIAGHALSDSVRVRIDKPAGNVLDLNFDDSTESPKDASGQNNHGKLFGDTLLLMHFDEGSGTEAKDESGYGNDGTFKNGALWTAGIQGNAVKLDGSDDFVEVPSVNPTSAITVGAWVKSATSTGYSAVWQIVSKYNAYILGISGTGPKDMCFIIYTTTWQYDTCYTVPDPQNWHYFVGTYDSGRSEKKLYVDGVLRDTDTVSGSINADAGPINLGQRECCPGEVFNGAIDEVAIYNRALTASEVQEIYSSGRAKFVEYVDGRFGKALDFDGVNDFVEIPNSWSLNVTNAITIEAWFLSSDGAVDDVAINKEPVYRLVSGEDAKAAIGSMLNINGAWTSFDTGQNLPVGKWAHLMVSWSGSSGFVRIYKDGTLVQEWSGRTGTLSEYNNPIIFGNYDPTGPYWYSGLIDEVRVYNRAYAPDELYVVNRA